jgi:hypothetical protein
MRDPGKILRKIRARSGHELYTRAAQLLAGRAELYGWSRQSRIPDDIDFLKLLDPKRFNSYATDSLLTHFRARKSPHFFTAFEHPEDSLLEFRRIFEGDNARITVDRATRIIEGSFDLLGLSGLSFGDPIDWHFDPLMRKRVPRKHWSKIDYLNPDVAGDKKIIWELNRQQYFATLGRAYWHTGDDVFAKTFAAHLEAWMNENPPKRGINWASSLEVAFRAISWLWALYFFKESAHLTEALLKRTLKFLYLHARHLETYLSTYFSPNTHLTGEALGLFYLGTLLPEFHESERWRNTGQRILLEQLERQVRNDGVYFEESSHYHRYTTDFYTHFLILSRANNLAINPALERKLIALLEHLMYITRPDGTSPLFGDDDGGRLLPLDERGNNNFRAALSNGAVLFHRSDFKYVSGEASEETFWLLGAEALFEYEQLASSPPHKESRAFPDGGYYVMRDGWTPDANYLLLACGPHGALNCGHSHADALSFDLAAKGRTLLIDPGTYTYTGSREMRDWFRSSRAHNTLTIAGKSSSVPAGPFSWQSIAHSEATKWIGHGRFDYFEGKHDGYSRLKTPTTHMRSVLFLKHDYWIICDKLQTSGQLEAELWFHFDSGLAPLIEAEGDSVTVVERQTNTGLEIVAFGGNGHWRRENGFVSHCYGAKKASRVYVFSVVAKEYERIVTFLIPLGKAASRWRVLEVEAIGGQAFEISHDEGLDVVMIGDGAGTKGVETKRVASDSTWAWVRFSEGGDEMPAQVVLLDASTLVISGREVIKFDRPNDYLVGRRVQETLKLETSAGNWEFPLPLSNRPRQSTT